MQLKRLKNRIKNRIGNHMFLSNLIMVGIVISILKVRSIEGDRLGFNKKSYL